MQDDKDFNKDGKVTFTEVQFDRALRDVFVDTDGNYDKEMADQAVAELRQMAQSPGFEELSVAENFVEDYGLTENDLDAVASVFGDMRKSYLGKQTSFGRGVFKEDTKNVVEAVAKSEQMITEMIATIVREDEETFKSNMASSPAIQYDPTKSMRDHMKGVKKSRGRSGRLASRGTPTGRSRPALTGSGNQGGSRIPKPEKSRKERKKADPSKTKANYAGMSLGLKTPARSGPHSESYYGPNDFMSARFYGQGVLVDRNRDGTITQEERTEARAIANSGALDPITFEYDKKEMLNKSLKRQQALKLDPKTYNIGGILVDANGDGIISLIEEEEAKQQALQNNIANVVASRDQDQAEKSLYGGMTREDAVRRFGEDLVLEREQAALEGPLGDYYAPTIKAATEGGIDPVTGETVPRDRSASFGGSAYDIPRGTMTFESAVQNAPEGGGRVPSGMNVAPQSPEVASANAGIMPSPTIAGTQLAGLGGGGAGGGRGVSRGQPSASVSSNEFRSVKREMQTLPNWRTVVG